QHCFHAAYHRDPGGGNSREEAEYTSHARYGLLMAGRPRVGLASPALFYANGRKNGGRRRKPAEHHSQEEKMKGSFDQEKALRAWQRFVQMGELVPSVPAPIARSWLRCKNRGQLPIQLLPGRLPAAEEPPACPPELAKAFPAAFQELEDYLAVEELLLVLLDPKGVLVDWQGNSRLIASDTLAPGMCFDEVAVGTMAMSLTLE